MVFQDDEEANLDEGRLPALDPSIPIQRTCNDASNMAPPPRDRSKGKQGQMQKTLSDSSIDSRESQPLEPLGRADSFLPEAPERRKKTPKPPPRKKKRTEEEKKEREERKKEREEKKKEREEEKRRNMGQGVLPSKRKISTSSSSSSSSSSSCSSEDDPRERDADNEVSALEDS